MARKLKVFQAQLGFYDTVVAAPSQAAALRAWGTHINLFADGMAQAATDEKAIEAALAQPEQPLRRAVGTKDPFSLNPGTPRLPDEPRTPAAEKTRPVVKKAAPPDRSALDKAEAALRSVDAHWKRDDRALRARDEALSAEEQSLRQRRSTLDADAAQARERHEKRRSEAEDLILRETRAFEKAGGGRTP